MATTYTQRTYTQSGRTESLLKALQEQLAAKPDAYSSQWIQQLDDTLMHILNQPEFSYELVGLVGNDDETALSALPRLIAGTQVETIGVYENYVKYEGATAQNYEITYENADFYNCSGTLEGRRVRLDAPIAPYGFAFFTVK